MVDKKLGYRIHVDLAERIHDTGMLFARVSDIRTISLDAEALSSCSEKHAVRLKLIYQLADAVCSELSEEFDKEFKD
jgi:hypothetical protein